MFTIETALVKKRLIDWFNKKLRPQYLEIDILVNNQHERKNAIDQNKYNCVICKIPLKIDLTTHQPPNDEMSYEDFFIRYDHNFFRNIHSAEELKESTQINTLESYYKLYQKLISICIGVLSIFGTNSNIDDDINSHLKVFLDEKFRKIDDIDKLKSNIEAVEIKNLIKSTGANKIPRFNLKLYAFIHDSLIDFSKSKFNYETITTDNFFKNVHRVIKVKIHLHHFHVMGEIFGYSHGFCNWKVRENKN